MKKERLLEADRGLKVESRKMKHICTIHEKYFWPRHVEY